MGRFVAVLAFIFLSFDSIAQSADDNANNKNTITQSVDDNTSSSEEDVVPEIDPSVIKANQDVLDQLKAMVAGRSDVSELKSDLDKLQAALDDVKASPTVEKGLLFDKMREAFQLKLGLIPMQEFKPMKI